MGAWSQYVSVDDSSRYSPNATFSFQITSLAVLPTYVRVSAVNDIGQSFATHAWPINATDCDTYPIHCSETPSKQLLWTVDEPVVRLSDQEVANRLEVSWKHPGRNYYGFITNDTGVNTPDFATHYRVEWSENGDFTNSTYHDKRMIHDDNVTETCLNHFCNFTIGEEVQSITLQSLNGEKLTAGEFKLLYVGKHTQKILIQVQMDSDVIQVMGNTTTNVGGYFRIGGDIYEVKEANITNNVLPYKVRLTKPFSSGFSDVVEAHYVNLNSLSCLNHDSNASAVDSYLDNLFDMYYPLYAGANGRKAVEVNAETSSDELTRTWRVTFSGEQFFDSVEDLIVLSSVDTALDNPCTTAFATASESPTLNVRTDVVTETNVGDLAHGHAVYVRVVPINSVGIGPHNNAVIEINDHGNEFGAINPRSKPGLPRNVKVFAIPSGTGDKLKVTWDEGETYGTPVTKYYIEYGVGTAYDKLKTITPEGTNSTFIAYGKTSFVEYIDITTLNSDHQIRVRQENERGQSGPSWFQYIGNQTTTEVNKVLDYNIGAQRAIPLCYSGLDECTERDGWDILPRGLPRIPSLTVPNYTQVDTANAFSIDSATIYYNDPTVNLYGIDKYRVEWDTDASFLNYAKHEVAIPTREYVIPNLVMGTTYFIRVRPHHSGGYGDASASYPFKPHQQPDAPSMPIIETANDANTIESYARSLNVSWNYPVVDVADLVGDGGDPVTKYLVEWSLKAFPTDPSVYAQVQKVRFFCSSGRANLIGRFRVKLSTGNDHDAHHDLEHHHLGQWPVVGDYTSAFIGLTDTVGTMETYIENLENIADVTVTSSYLDINTLEYQ